MPQHKPLWLRGLLDISHLPGSTVPGAACYCQAGLGSLEPLPPFPSADMGQGTASARERGGEGRSNRKETALRWRRREGNCQGGEDEDVWDPLPGGRFNADQMADVCFCDLCGGNMNKLRGSIHPPLCMQRLPQRRPPLLCPGGSFLLFTRISCTFARGEGTAVSGAGHSPARCG